MDDDPSVSLVFKKFIVRLTEIIVFSLACIPVQAGNDNFLPGARALALSGASVTLSDAWSTFSNQAGLAFITSPSAAFYSGNKFLVKEYAIRAVTLSIPLKPGAIGISGRYFGYSKYYEAKFGLTYARKFTDYFAAGIQIDYFQTHIAEGFGDYRSVAAELSFMLIPLKGFRMGVHVFNPSRVKRNAPSQESIPAIFRFGVSYSVKEKISVLTEIEKGLSADPVYKGGIEMKALENYFLRLGFSSGYEQYSFGFGYKYKRISVDFAFTKHIYLGFSPHCSFAFLIGKN